MIRDIYIKGVAAGGGADTDIEVNGVAEGSVGVGSTLDIQITDGVDPVTPDAVALVGNTLTIEVPSGGGGAGYVRPADWLTMPAIKSSDNDIAILHAVWDNDSNYAAFRCTTSAGLYDVDWGDGTTTSHASNTTAEHDYDYDTYDVAEATLSSRGYKQAIIRITPATGTLATFSSNFRYTGQNQIYSTGFLDVLLSMPSATSGASITFIPNLVTNRYMEQVEILNSGGMTSALSMFNGCIALQSVPLFDTSIVTNMQNMFANCVSLQSVPLFDTSIVISMTSMFQNCSSLQSVPLFDTSSVNTMQNMFGGCISLQSVPLFDTSSVTNMSGMLGGCQSLKSVPLFDTSSVTIMTNMFGSCSSLQSVPLFDTSSVTNMQGTFSSCVSLQTVPLFDTSLVNSMFNMFANCVSLQSVPTFDTTLVTSMTSMFQNCLSLQSVPLFDTSSLTNMQQMFQNCPSLQTVPLFNTSSVTNMGSLATNCVSMSKTDIVCRVTVAFNNNQLSQAGLVNIFNNLFDRTGLAAANINITGNYGAAALSVPERAIATNKNFTITG